MFLIDPSLKFDEEDLNKEDKWRNQEKLDDFKEKIRRKQAFVYFKETDLETRVLHFLDNLTLTVPFFLFQRIAGGL